jgi:hypothetical protein
MIFLVFHELFQCMDGAFERVIAPYTFDVPADESSSFGQ